jgi:hypothetical protein
MTIQDGHEEETVDEVVSVGGDEKSGPAGDQPTGPLDLDPAKEDPNQDGSQATHEGVGQRAKAPVGRSVRFHLRSPVPASRLDGPGAGEDLVVLTKGPDHWP